jgi:hypothetical protein
VLSEDREVAEHRRTSLEVLVFSPHLIRLERPAMPAFARCERQVRPRIVLYADGSPDVRWWDPEGAGGPVELGEVPLSPGLAGELARLREGYARLAEEGWGEDPFGWERQALDDRAFRLWCRARSELGRRFKVGFLGPDMTQPVWSPGDTAPPDDDGIFTLPA